LTVRIKGELIDTRSWPTRAELRAAIFDYIEGCTTPSAYTAFSITWVLQNMKHSFSKMPSFRWHHQHSKPVR